MTNRQDRMYGIYDSTKVLDANGVSMYDALNRPTLVEQTGPGDVPFERNHYQYDNLGRQVATWRDFQNNKGERFYYSPANQLTNVRYNADQVWTGNPVNWDRWVDYGYQPGMLNRWYVNDNGTNFSWYGANALNQYYSVGAQTPSYDSNFNLTGYDGASFAYNAASQLISASKNGSSVQFTYDGLGRCVKRTVNGASILFTYDGWKPFLEFEEWGTRKAYNIYGPGADEILWRYVDGSGHLRYHLDRQGNVAFLLDGASGAGIERYTYDAFGKPKITDWAGNERAQSLYGNRFMFTGREWIKELGIYDYRNRMYHPDLGRFLQKDPIGFAAGDANSFRYCGGDPVNCVDPYGLAGKKNGDKNRNNEGMGGGGEATTDTVIVEAPYDFEPRENGFRDVTDRNGGQGSLNQGGGRDSLAGGGGIRLSRNSNGLGTSRANVPRSTQGSWSNPEGFPTGTSWTVSDGQITKEMQDLYMRKLRGVDVAGMSPEDYVNFMRKLDTGFFNDADSQFYYVGGVYGSAGLYYGGELNYVGVGQGFHARGLSLSEIPANIILWKAFNFNNPSGTFRGSEFHWAKVGWLAYPFYRTYYGG